MNAKDYINRAIEEEGVDAIALRADVSRATIFRAKSGKNLRTDIQDRILSACGCKQIVIPSDHPHQQESGE